MRGDVRGVLALSVCALAVDASRFDLARTADIDIPSSEAATFRGAWSLAWPLPCWRCLDALQSILCSAQVRHAMGGTGRPDADVDGLTSSHVIMD